MYPYTMPFSISTVRFTDHFVIFDQIAVRIAAIESIEKSYDEATRQWCLKVRLDSGLRYALLFDDSVDNYFDRLTS
jgi:hypothetical protein